ncbi:hypothetical protein BDQ17DRAFT_1392770 [Cyathus striatus]|nr:hypothetical protein BDQ17DRAFT_1392770 [Cyathus striatus]
MGCSWDGDLERVKELVELQCKHAAASYGQIEVLEYLVSRGGDVNITDSDGDTPLYTVENIETARWLVDHGAVIDRRNNEGISPIEHLTEEFGQVAHYLHSLTTSTSHPPPSSLNSQNPSQPSQHVQNAASEHLTSTLMASVQQIMEHAEAEGRDPEEELRQAVSRTVLEGMITGFAMSTEEDASGGRGHDQNGVDSPAKRTRTEDGPG